MKFRRWFRRLCVFFKIKTTQILKHLYEIITSESHIYSARNSENVKLIIAELINLITRFFSYSITDGINLTSVYAMPFFFFIFRNSLLKIGRPMQNSIYNIHDPIGIKYLTSLRLGLSHLYEHKFRHNFQDCLNPFCSCSLEVKTTNHYFLHCNYCKTFVRPS